ncbi:MAG: hypothetical protein LBL76_00940, partial [Treponema sp.]|nr:hypothetical protein [Treponema sp.]
MKKYSFLPRRNTALSLSWVAGLLVSFGIVLGLASCTTSSKTQALSEAGPFARFPAGALVYLYVDTVKARPILNAVSLERFGGNPTTMAAVLDKTATAAVAFYPKGGPRRFLVEARGRYPRFQASLSFTFNAGWKKQRAATGASYWYAPQTGISIFLDADHAFVSDGDPLPAPDGSVLSVPETFALFAQDAVLAGWLTEGATPLNQFLQSLEIPLQIPAGQVLFSLQQSQGYYEGLIRLETPSVSQARALVSLFSMARLFMGPLVPGDINSLTDPQALGGLFFAHPPEQDGA